MKRLITMGLAALAVSAVLVSAGAELRKGQKMPQTELTDLNGAKVQLGGKSGKIQIIDFWAVWCGPCAKAMPKLQALHTKYKDRGVQVIGVALQSGTAQEVKQTVENRGVTYTICAPPNDKAIQDKYRIEAFPTIYVVDKKGLIRYASAGHDDAGILKALSDVMAE